MLVIKKDCVLSCYFFFFCFLLYVGRGGEEGGGGIEPPGVYGRVPAAEFREVMDDLLEAVTSPGASERTIESPVGTMSGEDFARFVALDGMLHGWDLAVSTGQHFELPPAVVADVDEFARGALTDELRDGDTFKDPVDAAPYATAIDRVAAFSGRTVPALVG